jgi:hypothetical protein
MGTFAPVFSFPFIDILLKFSSIFLIFSWLFRNWFLSRLCGSSFTSFSSFGPCLFRGIFFRLIGSFYEPSNEL